MAGIDKIYGNKEQYEELYSFLEKYKPSFIEDGLIPREYAEEVFENKGDKHVIPISYFSHEQDKWLWKYCPIEFVRERLKGQYGEDLEPLKEGLMNLKEW